ncbi:MAG: hypothetical protein ACFFAO_02075 [Candidatus Hermodarchaeota archaeon]
MSSVIFSNEEIIISILYLINFSFALFWGLTIFKKAYKTKSKMLYEFGAVIIFMGITYHTVAINFINWLILGQIISTELIVTICIVGLPIVLLSWMDIYLTTVHYKKPLMNKTIFIILSIISSLLIVIILYLTYLAPESQEILYIGARIDNVNFSSVGIFLWYQLFVLFISLLVAVHFSLISIKRSELEETKWKGVMIIIAVIFLIIGSMGVIILKLIWPEFMILLIFRILMVISTFFFYLGFSMPEFLKKFLKITN